MISQRRSPASLSLFILLALAVFGAFEARGGDHPAHDSMPPAFRAEAYNYREPHKVVVTAQEFSRPVVSLSAPSGLHSGGDPFQVGVVRSIAYRPDAVISTSSSSSDPQVLVFRSAGASRVRLHLTDVKLGGHIGVFGRDDIFYEVGPELLSFAGDLWTPSVEGDAIAIAFGANDHFTVSELAHIIGATPESTTCFIDASCATISDRDTLSAAIAQMTFVKGTGVYICTGGLINASVSDRLFLTANHCISSAPEAASLELTWDLRSTSCGASTFRVHPTTAGATLLATSITSDATLLRLTSLPANRWLLGWDTSRPASGTAIYRISNPGAPDGGVYAQTYSATTVSETSAACSSAPRPAFLYSLVATGGVGGGSSGAPVITQGGYIVGQLLGGCGPDPSDGCSSSTKTVDGWFGQSYALLQPFLKPANASCTPSSANLCLLNNRFRVSLTVNDPRVTGAGYANSTSQGDWGYFDVPAATGSNDRPVIFVKLIDGRPVNNRFWVFYGGLTDVQYTFVVTDTQTGATKTYSKATGTFDGGADVAAFLGN